MPKYRASILAVRNGGVLATMNNYLSGMCTSCFNVYFTIAATYAPAADLPAIYALSDLCTTDNSAFCYPLFQNALQAANGNGVNYLGRLMCQVS